MWLSLACHLHRSWKAERRLRPCFPTSAPHRAILYPSPARAALAMVQGPGWFMGLSGRTQVAIFLAQKAAGTTQSGTVCRKSSFLITASHSWDSFFLLLKGFGSGDTAPLVSITTEEYPKNRSGVFLWPSQWFWKLFNTLQKSFFA